MFYMRPYYIICNLEPVAERGGKSPTILRHQRSSLPPHDLAHSHISGTVVEGYSSAPPNHHIERPHDEHLSEQGSGGGGGGRGASSPQSNVPKASATGLREAAGDSSTRSSLPLSPGRKQPRRCAVVLPLRSKPDPQRLRVPRDSGTLSEVRQRNRPVLTPSKTSDWLERNQNSRWAYAAELLAALLLLGTLIHMGLGG